MDSEEIECFEIVIERMQSKEEESVMKLRMDVIKVAIYICTNEKEGVSGIGLVRSRRTRVVVGSEKSRSVLIRQMNQAEL